MAWLRIVKNVLKLVPYLIDMGYFKKVNFIFLVLGHTKILLIATLIPSKKEYILRNIFITQELIDTKFFSENVTFHPEIESDFLDLNGYLNKFYSSMTGKIRKNLIFSCSTKNFTHEGTQLVAKLRQSDLECDEEIDHYAIMRAFEGRHAFKSLKDAVSHHPNVIRKISLAVLHPLVIKPYKKAEMNKKYKEFVHYFWNVSKYYCICCYYFVLVYDYFYFFILMWVSRNILSRL